ncbi:polysaccharide biosynthesis/export family protein [Robbsia sp. KACC 23696]|uniref:polysaccharide biosynthesis/export family protein n=1 Tax=Robbsia sp. KACC 23696 TaxID=3149231 RepID=UPI00325B7A67
MLSRAVLFSCLGVATLGGCMWAPGSYLDTSSMTKANVVSTEDESYLVQPITPEVVLRQGLAQKQAAKAADAHIDVPVGAPKHYVYKIEPQDILSITVWDHPELSLASGSSLGSTMSGPTGGTSMATPFSQTASGGMQNDPTGYTVQPNGTIFFPYAGTVSVGGRSTDDVQHALVRALSRYINMPQVTVRILAYRSQQVQLTGQFKTNGTLPITDHPLTMADAISRAGGASDTGDLQRVRLIRDGKTTIVNAYALLDRGDVSQNVLLQGGDVVNVPDQIDSRVFVLGEVIKPTTLYMNKGRLTLADAVTGAQGVDNTAANVREVFVFRGGRDNPTEPQIYQLDMTQPGSLLLAAQFQMDPLDVVYVGTAKGVRFNRVLALVTPTLSSLFYLKQLSK